MVYIFFFLFSDHLPSPGPFSTLRSGQEEILRKGAWLPYLELAAYPTLAILSWLSSPNAKRNYLFSSLDFPGGSEDKSVCLQCRRPGFDPQVGKIPMQKEMATHSSTLAWKIRWMEEPGRLQSMGSQRVGHDWATSLHFSNQTDHKLSERPDTSCLFIILSYAPRPVLGTQ